MSGLTSGPWYYLTLMTHRESSQKKRFGPGAQVEIINPGGIVGTVLQVGDAPTIMGEFWHIIRTEFGEKEEPGSNLELVPTPQTNQPDMRFGAPPMSKTADVIKGIKQLRKEVADIRAALRQADRFAGVDEGLLNEKLKKWSNRVYEQLKTWGLKREAEEGFGLSSVVRMYEGVDARAKAWDDKLNALLDDISSHPDHYEGRLAAPPQEAASKEEPKAQRIFLGHGNNKLWARVHMYLKDELHLDVEVWESSPRTGLHSVDVLKTVLASCTFAVMVATGEDATAEGGLRARQNVVHEIGLFQGRLGFEKVALLQQRGVEEFSNLAGLQVILFSDSRVEETFYELRRMLERERVLS